MTTSGDYWVTADSGLFNRRIPLWEGHTRPALEGLVDALAADRGNPRALASAVVNFLGKVAVGFSPSAFGDTLESEAAEGCMRKRRGKPAGIQELARFLVTEPDHHGVAKMLRRLAELISAKGNFAEIEIDCHKELWDAVRLGDFETPDDGLAEITHRRAYSHPKPPPRAISTIYKAKGLECDGVIVMPCDAKTFPDRPHARCLLYVALSRARRRLLLVVSRSSPSPLLVV
jgi:DNA helicase-2/ATP-dependent DNA helicase PcrA